MDLAHLGIKIDYADIDKAVNKLKELEKVSSTVERQTKDISFTTKSNTELNKLNAELKALNKQAQILGETSSVSAREVDRLAAKLKYLEKQASLKGLSQGNRELQNIIRQTGQSIDSLTGKIKTSDNIVKRWWKRFGEVGVGFTLIYQTVNLVTGAIHSLNQVILDGIKLSGELVSAQAKLSMWLEMGSQGAISFQEAMNASKQTIQALADASLTSTSTLKELATGLDEVSQAGVFISKDVMPKFADLIDFTKMVAETTGSTTRQIRQELQALMQGQVKTTNLLIRTAQQLHILTDEDIQGLKEMQNRQEVIEKLSESISSYWEKVKEVIISADVNTAFDKWYDSLTRLVTKATELTSEKQGTMNIFGATIYKHIQELNKELQNMNVEKYENFFLGLNIALDKFLTLAEKAVKGLMSIDISTDSVNLKFKELEHFLKGVLTPFQLFYKIAKDLDDKLVDLTGALEDMGIHLVSIHKIVGEAFVYRLIFGNWKAGFVLATLTEIDNLISDIIGEGGKSHSIINSLKGATEYGIIGTYLFGWKAGLIIGTLKLVVDYFGELRKAGEEARRKKEGAASPYIQEHLDKYFAKKYPTTPEELEKWRKKVDEELDKTVKKYKKAIEEINNALKKLKEDAELEEYAQKIKKSLMTPIEKLIEEKKKLDKAVNADKITKEEELEYLAKEAASYYNLKDSIKDLMKILSQSPDTWEANIKKLQENIQAIAALKKHIQELHSYAQQLEESAQTPLEKFITGFKKLQETAEVIGLSNRAYAQGLLELSKNIVDTTDKEEKLRKAFELYADELKQMPAEEVAVKIKELAEAFEEHESAWQKGIKAYINDVKSMKDEIADLIHGMFSELEDILVRFLTSGKLSIKDFSEYIINQIARIYARQYMVKPLAQYMYNIVPSSSSGQFGGSGFSFNNIPWSSLGNIFSTPSTPAYTVSDLSIGASTLVPASTAAMTPVLSTSAESASLYGSTALNYTPVGGSEVVLTPYGLETVTPAATTSTALSFSQALPYAGWSALGYSTLGNWIGLPQSQYSSLTAGAGGMAGAMLASSVFAVNPIAGAIIGALVGGAGGGLLGQSHVDDVDLHIYFGNPNVIPTNMAPWAARRTTAQSWTDNPDIQGFSSDIQFSGSPNREFFERDRAINDFMSVNIRKGSYMSDEQARQLEQAIADYFQGLFNSIDTQFNISVENVLKDQAVGFHENDYSGDLQATLSKYTDEFFKNFTDELTESILGYSIDYNTLKKFQQSGESISDTFSRVVGNLKNIPHAGELISKYLTQTGDKVVEATEQTSKELQALPESAENISDLFNQSGDKAVEAYNKLTETWAQINDLVDKAFQNMTLPKSVDDFKKQLTTNIRLEIAQALEQSYMEQLAQQTKEWLLERFGITGWSQLIENLQNGTISLEAFNAALEELADSVGGTADKIIQKANEVISQVEPEQPTESDHEGYSNVQEALQAGDYNAVTQMLFPFAQTAGAYVYAPESAQDTTQQQVQSILEDLQKIDITKGWKDFKEEFMKTIADAITEQLQSKFITDVTQNINSYLAERYNPYDIINNIWANVYNAGYAGGISSLDMASIAEDFRELKQSLELTGEGLQKINSDIQRYTSYQNIDEVISQLEAGNVNYGDIESLASILVQERLNNFPVINNIDDLINQINSGAITIEQASKILGDINQILDDNKKDYDEIFLKLVAIGEIDLSGIIDKIPNITDVIQNYVTASNSSLVEAYEKLVEQWDYINKLISDSLKQIKDPFSHNLKQQFLTNFKQQIGEKLIQKFYQNLGDQITGYIFSTFGIADYTELVDAVYSGKISIEGLTNALDDMGNVIDSNNSKLDELFVKQIQLGNIDISWVNNIENISQIVQDYINRTGKGLVSAYEELKDEWDYIYNLVSQSFQNITLPFDTKSLKQQFFSNFKLNLGNQILQAFYKDLNEQITGAILSKYGMSDLEQLSNWLLDGKLSTEDFNNALEDLGNILDQNNPKIEHLKQILEDLGLLDDYYKQQYEQAKANYISALQAEISDLQQKQQQLEQNFQKAKQTYIQVLQNEISELQKAQQQLEQNFQKAKNDYINALQAEINKKQEATNSAKSLIETFKNLSDSLESFKQDLIGSETNPASYNYTRAQFLSLIPKLDSSDNKILQETIQKIPDTARAFLEQSKQYNTYEEYLKNYYSVIKIINKAQDKSLGIQKEQQNKLDNIKSEIEELNERYKEINGQDIKDLAEAEQAYYQAKLELDKSHYPEEIQKYNDILEELQGTLPDIATASKDYRDALNALKNSYYPTAIQKYQDILKELQGIHRDLPTAEKEYRKAKKEYEQHTGNKTNGGNSSNNNNNTTTTTSRLVVNDNTLKHVTQATAVDMVLTGRVSAETYVENLYEKYLGRKADTSGLHYWTEQAKKAKSYSDLYHLERAFKEAAKSHGEQLKARFYAKGGTVYKPTLAVVGEAGIEHITPDSQMKEVKEKLGEIKEILWMMLNTTGDNKKVLIKLNNLITGWDYEGLPATREQ